MISGEKLATGSVASNASVLGERNKRLGPLSDLRSEAAGKAVAINERSVRDTD